MAEPDEASGNSLRRRLARLDENMLGPPPPPLPPATGGQIDPRLVWLARIGTLVVAATGLAAMAIPSLRWLFAVGPALGALSLAWIARLMARDPRKRDAGAPFSLLGAAGFLAFAGWCWGQVPLGAFQVFGVLVLGFLGARAAWIVHRHWVDSP